MFNTLNDTAFLHPQDVFSKRRTQQSFISPNEPLLVFWINLRVADALNAHWGTEERKGLEQQDHEIYYRFFTHKKMLLKKKKKKFLKYKAHDNINLFDT